MSDQFGPKRPLGVTIVAALAIIAAVFDIIGGIVLLMQGDTDAAAGFGGTGMMVTLGISSILFGAFMLVVSYGLLRGNSVSRIAATVVQVFSLASSIWIGVAQPSTLPTEILSGLLALAILMLLWSGEATRYFKGLAPDQPTS